MIGSLAISGWIALSDPASAAPTPRDVAAAPFVLGQCLTPKTTADEPAICPRAAKRKARQFRRDRLGNAKGLKIPQRVQRKIRRKAAKMRGRQADCCDWITEPLKATTCLVTNPSGVHRGVCDEGQKALNERMERTTQVAVMCGGAAVVGAGKNGGNAWGAGAGGALCLWGYYFQWFY